MSLPFDLPDKNKRKHTCFVCGLMFPEWVEMNKHLLENHQADREYIVCPLPHCGACVRDMYSHFKVKHPNINMPKTGMTQAVIWYDFNGKGERKARKPKFKEGFHYSTKMNKEIHYRSGYEKTIYECLDADVEVIAYDGEPFAIEYIHKGKAHKYTPDIIVRFLDGHTELWEIKPSAQTLLPKNQDKWFHANEACKTRGWEFVVITEVGISRLKQKIRNQH
jgi:hypothetical protein